MPPGLDDVLDSVTGVLVTHEHPDHLDSAARKWIRDRELPVWAGSIDVDSLRGRGLDAHDIQDNDLGIEVEVIPALHGWGWIGWLMGPVSGFYLAHPDEPSLYVTSDGVLDEEIHGAVTRLQPDIVLAPAGAANFGFGPNILFSLDEMVELVRVASGTVVFNHLESIDHCPTTRLELRQRMDSEGFGDRVHIPEDGEVLTLERSGDAPHAAPKVRAPRKPGFQKWLTAKMA